MGSQTASAILIAVSAFGTKPPAGFALCFGSPATEVALALRTHSSDRNIRRVFIFLRHITFEPSRTRRPQAVARRLERRVGRHLFGHFTTSEFGLKRNSS